MIAIRRRSDGVGLMFEVNARGTDLRIHGIPYPAGAFRSRCAKRCGSEVRWLRHRLTRRSPKSRDGGIQGRWFEESLPQTIIRSTVLAHESSRRAAAISTARRMAGGIRHVWQWHISRSDIYRKNNHLVHASAGTKVTHPDAGATPVISMLSRKPAK